METQQEKFNELADKECDRHERKRNVPSKGIHPAVPFDEYCQWDAVNQSRLKVALSSLKRYHANVERPDTPDFKLGRMIHTGRLEPHELLERYVSMPDFASQVKTANGDVPANPRATKQYKELVAEFEAEAEREGKEIIEPSELEKLTGTLDALYENERIREYFADGAFEVCFVWDDPETGIRCKARADCWQMDKARITDLKKSRDVKRFRKWITNYGYDFQAGFYSEGIEILTGERHEFCLAAVEDVPPYETVAAPFRHKAVLRGRAKFHKALRLVKAAMDSGHWPGYDNPDEWDVEAYAQTEVLDVYGELMEV